MMDVLNQIKIFRGNSNSPPVYTAQVGTLEQTDKPCLHGFLQSQDGGTLEFEVHPKVLCNLVHQSLKWEEWDQKIHTPLEMPDFTQGNHGVVSARLGFNPLSASLLMGGFSGQLFSRGLSP